MTVAEPLIETVPGTQVQLPDELDFQPQCEAARAAKWPLLVRPKPQKDKERCENAARFIMFRKPCCKASEGITMLLCQPHLTVLQKTTESIWCNECRSEFRPAREIIERVEVL